ncbi:unnamed protein product [Closterium sp. NIES-54]
MTPIPTRASTPSDAADRSQPLRGSPPVLQFGEWGADRYLGKRSGANRGRRGSGGADGGGDGGGDYSDYGDRGGRQGRGGEGGVGVLQRPARCGDYRAKYADRSDAFVVIDNGSHRCRIGWVPRGRWVSQVASAALSLQCNTPPPSLFLPLPPTPLFVASPTRLPSPHSSLPLPLPPACAMRAGGEGRRIRGWTSGASWGVRGLGAGVSGGCGGMSGGERGTDGHAVGMMGRLYDLMLQLTEDVGGLLDADEEQLSDGAKDKIRRILRDRWDGSLACAMHVAGRILNPANQEEDIFGTDLECTKVFKAFISQQAEFLASRRDGGDDACDILLELGDGLRAFLDMKGSFGMPEAVAQRKLVKEGKYSMVKWWQWNGTDAPRVAGLAVRVLSQAVSASPCERGWSSWDVVHTARRNRLGSAKCRDLVYVAHNWNVVRNWHTRADVLPHVVPGIGAEPPIPVGYNGLEDETKGEDEEEGEDDILEDEYAN